ncbi:PREDICTED: uncharacterized protein LOC104824295 [Tarenaya hassleriana]|uniref:uncharacterized protein LOC104824295 n=1 Tax=Tarenaya hassleriana TaxID=28532 RepID=UPI00053CA648|nr:PREDICTED: uncharacterized protein LOC104824295 [Tarenaya hassleriana]
MAVPSAGDMLPASLSVANLPMEKALGLKDKLTPSQLGFPREFPFEFDSPTFTSPDDSTETEDDGSDDEEDFFAGLTRRLALSTQRHPPPLFANDQTEEKRQIVSTSPQSTLSGLGSWSASGSGSPNGPSSQVPSPPTTPFRKDDAWDIISAAAGQVAKLKMGGGRDGDGERLLFRPNPNPSPNIGHHSPAPEPILPQQGKHQSGAFCSDPRFQQFNGHSKPQFYADWLLPPESSYYLSQLKCKSPEKIIPGRVSGISGYENGRCFRSSTWLRSHPPPPPSQQQSSSAVRGVFPVGSAAKRPCAGTGVFLPRRYTNPSDSRKKTGGGSSVVFSSKGVQPQNLNFDEFNDRTQPHSRPCLSSGHNQFDYESLMARRRDLLARQRQGGGLRAVPGGCLNQERPLPQEWTY